MRRCGIFFQMTAAQLHLIYLSVPGVQYNYHLYINGTVFIILSKWYNTIILLHLLRRNCFCCLRRVKTRLILLEKPGGDIRKEGVKTGSEFWPLHIRLIHAFTHNNIKRTDTLNPTAMLNYAFQHNYVCFGVIPFDWKRTNSHQSHIFKE